MHGFFIFGMGGKQKAKTIKVSALFHGAGNKI